MFFGCFPEREKELRGDLSFIELSNEEINFFMDLASYVDYDVTELKHYTKEKNKEYGHSGIYDLPHIPRFIEYHILNNYNSLFEIDSRADITDLINAVNEKFWEINEKYLIFSQFKQEVFEILCCLEFDQDDIDSISEEKIFFHKEKEYKLQISFNRYKKKFKIFKENKLIFVDEMKSHESIEEFLESILKNIKKIGTKYKNITLP